MAVPGGPADQENRFPPSAVLLGPGWGRSEDRIRLFEACLPLEKKGVPLILDADAIPLAKNVVFNGNAILTPHAGEFMALTGLAKDAILSDTVNILKAFSAEKKAHVLFKSHVTYIASPDGRIGIVDGMNPLLAAGGSGDVLAGFCAAIAARSYTSGRARSCASEQFDGYACACAAASLLARTAESKGIAGRFTDPAELAHAAAGLAGSAWLGRSNEK
jgi:NAD(P)H-hydrate epimerase